MVAVETLPIMTNFSISRTLTTDTLKGKYSFFPEELAR
jgi:hypothetical protein